MEIFQNLEASAGEKLRHRDLESENYVRHMERNIIGMEFHLKLRMKVSHLAR